MVASTLIDYAGASAAFVNGFVTYTNESKHRLLGVSNATLEKFGAVSSQTAEEMCKGAADVSPTDVGLSTTGIAGPGGGTTEKPVGLVYIGVCVKGHTVTRELRLKGNRTEIRKQATTAVLELLGDCLADYK
jgi:nicotinamide-nucleotide amidase